MWAESGTAAHALDHDSGLVFDGCTEPAERGGVGEHRRRVAVAFGARYSSYLPGDAFMSPVTLVATTVPHS